MFDSEYPNLSWFECHLTDHSLCYFSLPSAVVLCRAGSLVFHQKMFWMLLKWLVNYFEVKGLCQGHFLRTVVPLPSYMCLSCLYHGHLGEARAWGQLRLISENHYIKCISNAYIAIGVTENKIHSSVQQIFYNDIYIATIIIRYSPPPKIDL